MRNRLRTCTTFNSSKLDLLVASCVWCGCLRCGMLLSRGYGHLLHLKGQALMDELRRQGGLDEEELVMLQYMLCDYRERVSSEALRSKSRVLQRAAYDLEQLQRSADSRDAHMTQLDAEVQKEREEGLLRLPQHLQRSVPPIQWGEQRTPSGVAGAFGPGGILQAPLGVQPLQPVLAEQQWQQQPISYHRRVGRPLGAQSSSSAGLPEPEGVGGAIPPQAQQPVLPPRQVQPPWVQGLRPAGVADIPHEQHQAVQPPQHAVPPIQWGEQRAPSGVVGALGPGGILQAPLGVQPLQPVLAEQQWQQQPIRYVPVGGVLGAQSSSSGGWSEHEVVGAPFPPQAHQPVLPPPQPLPMMWGEDRGPAATTGIMHEQQQAAAPYLQQQQPLLPSPQPQPLTWFEDRGPAGVTGIPHKQQQAAAPYLQQQQSLLPSPQPQPLMYFEDRGPAGVTAIPHEQQPAAALHLQQQQSLLPTPQPQPLMFFEDRGPAGVTGIPPESQPAAAPHLQQQQPLLWVEDRRPSAITSIPHQQQQAAAPHLQQQQPLLWVEDRRPSAITSIPHQQQQAAAPHLQQQQPSQVQHQQAWAEDRCPAGYGISLLLAPDQ
jgi:hypothetical protein